MNDQKKTLAQLIALNVEAAVPAVEAHIKSIGKWNHFDQGQYGPYSFQDIILHDAGTDMACTLATRDEIPQSMVGQRVVFVQGMNGRGKMGGVKTSFRGKGNDKKFCLYVTGEATMTSATQLQAPQSQSFTTQSTAAPAQNFQPSSNFQPPTPPPPQPSRPPQAVALSDEDRVKQALDYLERAGNFYQLAMDEAHTQRSIWDGKHPESKLPDFQFEKMCAGFCQGAEKAGIIISMPTGDISSLLPK